jgi:hypothetical protein|tara:strand:- start:613 stop:1719 length:1107 start_codon:yes stop_codon:yes gene_type:complete
MKIIVLGRESESCYTALHYKHYAPHVEVEIMYDDKIPIHQTGQVTYTDAAELLWEGLRTTWHKNPMKASFKTGILYKDWGQKNDQFFHPFPLHLVGLQYPAQSLQDYVLKSGLFTIKVNPIPSYNKLDADFIFDCRGFPDDYTDYELLKNPLNSILLSEKKEERPYEHWTTATATPNGWSFELPLLDRVSLGYLYNDTLTSSSEATEDFKERFKINEIKHQFQFKNYIANNPIIDGRIILNGKRLFFLESLEFTALSSCLRWNREVYDWIIIKGTYPPILAQQLKERVYQTQNFILYHYLFGSKYDTPFWKHCKDYKITDPLFTQRLHEALASSFKDIVGKHNRPPFMYGLHAPYSFKNMYEGLRTCL